MDGGENEQENDPTTPKKSRNLKRKHTPKKNTPQKATKGNRALPFFNGPTTRIENGVTSTYYKCTICNKELNGNNLSNLASHLQTKHDEIFEEYIGPIEDSIAVKRLKLLQNCVSIVALGGRPFASLNDYGFQQIIHEQLAQFASAGIPLDIKQKNQLEVHEHLKVCAQQVRECIKKTIKGQALSIQLDIATRLGRSVFGINIQFISNKKLNIHNIGMIELEKAHTGTYLSQVYRQCLEQHDIIRQQIVSISADNGSNMQKMIRIEQENAQTDSQNPVVRQLDLNPNSWAPRDAATIDKEIEAVLATTETTDDDIAIIEIFEECGINLIDATEHIHEHEVLLRDTVAQITNDHDHNLFDLTGIRCAAHTLQLIVKDGLKELRKESSNIINLCRRVIKALKLRSTKSIVEEANLKMTIPSLDVETRWGSTYDMLHGLTSLKDVIECVARKSTEKRYKEFPLLLEKWHELKDFVRILSIPYKATVDLQRRDLTLSDTYGIWVEIKLRLQKTKDNGTSITGLADMLLTEFDKRYDVIFANPAMIAAIYLDPRYRLGIVRNEIAVKNAKEFIIEMNHRLTFLKSVGNETDSQTNNAKNNDSNDNFDIQSEMNRYWGTQSIASSVHQSDFEATLDAFDPPRMAIRDNLFEYWDGPECDPYLRDVAMAIFSISPTEVETERDFSALKRVLTDHRSTLSKETLQNIMTINLNQDLYLKNNDEQIKQLRNK